MCTLPNILAFCVVFYAYIMYDVAVLTPVFSRQWFAEMSWWSKIVFLRGIDFPHIPPHILEHKHSHLEVVELFPAHDAQAFDKFLAMCGKKENDHKIIILRNVWANYTETPFAKMGDLDYLRENINPENEYNTFSYGKHPPGHEFKPLGELMELMLNVSSEDIDMLGFEVSFAKKEKFVWDAYVDLWEHVSPELGHRIINKMGHTHNFLYYGNRASTPLHGAIAADYFFQVANTKQWTFIHKRYAPYMGVQRKHGDSLIPPFYLAEDYPDKFIPHTTTYTRPGDLMYFGAFHQHQVHNVHPDKVGIAIGIRPKPYTNPDSSAFFMPLAFHNIVSFPMLAWQVGAGTKGKLKRKFGKDRSVTCANTYNQDWDFGYNGVKMTRFDYRMVDGKCTFIERKNDYQRKEILGLLDPHADYPISM